MNRLVLLGTTAVAGLMIGLGACALIGNDFDDYQLASGGAGGTTATGGTGGSGAAPAGGGGTGGTGGGGGLTGGGGTGGVGGTGGEGGTGGSSTGCDVLTVPPTIYYRAETLGLTQGASVTSWPDGSGNGHHASGAGGSWSAPLFVSHAINSLPAVEFDNGRGLLAKPLNTLFGSDAVFTVLSVSRWDDTVNNEAAVWRFGDGTENQSSIRFAYSDQGNGFKPGLKSWSFQTAAVLAEATSTTSGAVIYSCTRSAQDISLHVNGALAQSNSAPALDMSGSVGEFAIGFSHPAYTGTAWKGVIAEIIVYPGALSSIQRPQVEQCLSLKYGIPLQ